MVGAMILKSADEGKIMGRLGVATGPARVSCTLPRSDALRI